MSAIAGIFSRSGAAIETGTLEDLSRKLHQRGPDGERFEISASMAMVHRPLHTESESRFTPQPVVFESGHILALDGRLDNRRELHRELFREPGSNPRTVDLILAAYRRWGIDAFARLIGDFAVALWDPKTRRLLLVCDSLGLRPLYYHATSNFIVWSSQARALREALHLPLELHQEAIADFLTNRPSPHSPFQGIEAVPGGHALVVQGDAAELKRYWDFSPRREIRYRSDEDYEAHFNELFHEAVACRLRSEAPVFAELSGGVDSSSIVCVADRILDSGKAETPDLHTASYVFDSSPSADERPYIRLIEEQRGKKGLHILDEEHPILAPIPPGFQPDLPTSQICFLSRHDYLERQMRQRGSRVLLSGIGGDQVAWSEPPEGLELADLLVEGRPLAVLGSCYRWSRWMQMPYLKMLWLGVCRPFLPRRLKARTGETSSNGEWFAPGFLKRTNLVERRLGLDDDLGFRLPSRSQQYVMFRQTMRIFALERCLSEGSIEVRYPYLDRRLLEWVLAIPLDQKVRIMETRSLVRRAFKGILPEQIRLRRTKAGPSEAFHRAIVRQWSWLAELITEPRVVRYGFVNREAFRKSLHRARHGLVTNSVQLTRTVALELWLRSLESGSRWQESRDVHYHHAVS